MKNPIRRLFVSVLAGAVLCSALVAGCGGDAAQENVGVSKVARNAASPPPPEALQAANQAQPK